MKDEFKRQKENTSSAVEMLVRKRIERVMPTFYQDSPNKNTHRRSQSGDVCSTIEGDHERLSLDHVQTWRDLCLRDDKTKESEIHVTPSFSSSVCSELVGIKNQQLPVHLLSAKNEQKKSTSPSQLSQYVGSGKEVQQVLPFKLADATGGKSSTQAGPPPKSASHSVSILPEFVLHVFKLNTVKIKLIAFRYMLINIHLVVFSQKGGGLQWLSTAP